MHELTNQRRIIITHCGVLANGQPPLHVRLPGARRIPPNRSLEELCNRADGPIPRKQAHDLIGVWKQMIICLGKARFDWTWPVCIPSTYIGCVHLGAMGAQEVSDQLGVVIPGQPARPQMALKR
jgi:hypothetical protein